MPDVGGASGSGVRKASAVERKGRLLVISSQE
jgi:hypothetical protein